MASIAELYRGGRLRLIDLARDVTPEQEVRAVPACPGWSVRDVYAHLTGVVVDALEGRLDGVATDPWTARQVAARAGRPLVELCAEWETAAPQFEAAIEAFGDATDPRLIVDLWNHEQDVRGALDRQGERTGDCARFALEWTVLGVDAARRAGGRPALRITGTSREWVVGDGDPVATIRAADFELARGLIGRRSARQLAAMVVAGGPAGVARELTVFGPAADDLVE